MLGRWESAANQLLLRKSIQNLFRSNQGFLFWHLDATGSLVPKWKGKQVFCYAVVIATPIQGEPALPLLEWLSNTHDSKAICKALGNWWMDVKSLISKPSAVVVDCSWALLHAVAFVLNGETLQGQLHKQWEIMKFGSGQQTTTITVIRLCVSHYIKAVITRLAKQSIPKQVRKSNSLPKKIAITF